MFSKAECRVKWDSCISDILKRRIWGSTKRYAQSQTIHGNFTRSAPFDQDEGLLMVYMLFADDLVLFSESAEGLQKQLTALRHIMAYHGISCHITAYHGISSHIIA